MFGEIRTMTNEKGETFFVGKDVAKALGYSNVRDALNKHVDAEDKGVAKCDTLGGAQKTTLINESGLYSLILSSQLEQAKAFKRWVTSEVLPQIRQTGGYIPTKDAEGRPLTEEEIMERAHEIIGRTLGMLNQPNLDVLPFLTCVGTNAHIHI
jgi:prophage antirepressor-like protein